MSGNDERRDIIYCECGNTSYYYVVYDGTGTRIGFVNLKREDNINPIARVNGKKYDVRRVLLEVKTFKCGKCERVYTKNDVIGRKLYRFGEKYLRELEGLEH